LHGLNRDPAIKFSLSFRGRGKQVKKLWGRIGEERAMMHMIRKKQKKWMEHTLSGDD